ncbi:hypothetical protein [uncultured Oscillibacter sp.]|uniref:hypothetical protein n=1 Tax=uncultured Oscillibacter sp. TaxID=876091 RepID=UPI0025DD4FEB|nr:hypothetical protein [uncultured Oscillibacter sp.]
MIDEKLYQETFSRLRASDRAKEEVFLMKEQRTHSKRIPKCLRAAAIAAAMTLALAATAGAANLATDGMLFQSLRQVWSDGYESQYEAKDAEGNTYQLTVTDNSTITQSGDRMMLHAAGEDLDITDAMKTEGAYHFEKETGRNRIQVDVTGTLKDWTMVEEVTGEDGITHRSTSSSEDLKDMKTGAAVVGEKGSSETVENTTTVTTTATAGE